MPVQLQFVQTIEGIGESLHSFNDEALAHPALTSSLLAQTTYWIYDPDTRAFGPSKFVGFQDMHRQGYESARERERLGVAFDGGQTRLKIEKLLGEEFVPNAKMTAALEAWAAAVLAPDDVDNVLSRIDKSKWLFISLPAVSKPRDAWGRDEIALTVEDYFVMLQAQLAGRLYNKAVHRNRLVKRLNGRSGPAVEYKHCNISAVLEDRGRPFISGYKPRSN